MTTTRDRYNEFLRQRHRPAHARRTVQSHAAFFLPHLRPGMRVLDLGCGPGSITAGLGEAVGPDGSAVGIDLDPVAGDAPAASADTCQLPFADATFDALFSCAMLQHLPDPQAALTEARRVCRSGAVIGVADADWGGVLITPPSPLLDRGHEILEALRPGTSPYVGRELRGLLHNAGFVNATAQAKGAGGGDPSVAFQAGFQAAAFEAPEAIAVVVDEGIATADEMAAIAQAWRIWGNDPAAVSARWWFEAVAFAP